MRDSRRIISCSRSRWVKAAALISWGALWEDGYSTQLSHTETSTLFWAHTPLKGTLWDFRSVLEVIGSISKLNSPTARGLTHHDKSRFRKQEAQTSVSLHFKVFIFKVLGTLLLSTAAVAEIKSVQLNYPLKSTLLFFKRWTFGPSDCLRPVRSWSRLKLLAQFKVKFCATCL